MDRLIDLIAPRGWVDGFFRGAVMLFLVVLTNYLINGPLRGYEVHLGSFIFNTSAVAVPFLALAMTLLHHQRQLQHRLVSLAATDMLTGLANRRSFMDVARTRLHASSHNHVVLMIDADHFKRINDVYGHCVGDLCLQHIADHLRTTLADTALIGRIGGEEFSALLHGSPGDMTRDLATGLCRAILVATDAGSDVAVTLSIGLAQIGPGHTLEQAMTNADKALYAAKLGGRARLEVWGGDTADDPAFAGDRRAS